MTLFFTFKCLQMYSIHNLVKVLLQQVNAKEQIFQDNSNLKTYREARAKRYPKNPNEKINNPLVYMGIEIQDIEGTHRYKWMKAKVIDKE